MLDNHMPDSVLEKIEQGWKLFNEGREEEALSLTIDIEKTEDLSPEEELGIKILKANIHSSLGHMNKYIEIVEETYCVYEKLNNDFLLMDAIILKLFFLMYQGQQLSKLYIDLIERGEIILKSISNRSDNESARKEARFLFLKGILYYNQGNYDGALECAKSALKLMEQLNVDTKDDQRYNRHIVGLLGHIYTSKGNPNLALEYHEKSLSLKIRDTNLELWNDANEYLGMGNIFYLKGDLDKALRFYKKTLAILEELNLVVKLAYISGVPLQSIIRVLIAKGDLEGAQHYLHLLTQINDENPIEHNVSSYNLLRGKLLKSSTRSRDRAEAEKIFKEIIEKDNQFSYLVNSALMEICDLYLKELKFTNDLTIIDEINPFITQLLENAEKGNSYSNLAKTKLLQAKIALIQMNMGDARRFLTKAQEIADKNGFNYLAQTISTEHDNLIGQLDVWENLKKSNAPISDRVNLASLGGSVEDLIENREIKKTEVVKEQPILLLIIIEGGVLLLSYPFTDEWKSNDDQFGSFLTAFMSFSNEFFADGLERAKFGEYTVLMENFSKFSICYLYKGQTYPAKKKIEHFIERLQNSPSIMKTLDKFYETSQVIEVDNFPFLEGFITEIFIN
jgi:tetratricopeptide (TPR) repeat protein